MISDVLAGIPVDDFETARAWYEIFAGRPPDSAPKPGEAVWRLADAGWVHVVTDAARAGSAIVTLLVDDLERHVGSIALRGIAPDSIEAVPGAGLRATISDPAGNTITLTERVGAREPGSKG